MTSPPKSVIHINFMAGALLFDARPIWTALRQAEAAGNVSSGMAQGLFEKFGDKAIHLGTRHYLMKQAVAELKNGLTAMYDQVPEPWNIPVAGTHRVVSGTSCERWRDRTLLAVDSFLFEFRAFLDLLAQFVHGVLIELGKAPARREQLSSGKSIDITDIKGKLKPHGFLLYLCDKCGVAVGWYDFLSSHRNFFTHEGAPYCAIEDRMARPPEFDLIVMKGNIQDFQHADPRSFFRVSECDAVVQGITTLSASAQKYLLDVLR